MSNESGGIIHLVTKYGWIVLLAGLVVAAAYGYSTGAFSDSGDGITHLEELRGIDDNSTAFCDATSTRGADYKCCQPIVAPHTNETVMECNLIDYEKDERGHLFTVLH